MFVNGCHIVSKLNAEGEEGFESVVTKNEVTKGPFLSMRAAVECARDWDKAPEQPKPVIEQPEVKAE